MSINYTTYVSQVSNLMIVASSDTNFQTFLPGCIDYAELRIYRELDFVFTTVVDQTATTSSGVRTVTLPSTWVVVEEVSVFSPAGATSSNGTRVELTSISREFINNVYPANNSFNGTPQYWNRLGQAQIMVGPVPDATYNVEIIGTQRPASLSSANSSTFLTAYLPDLFIAASMVFAFGYQRDFGAQADQGQASQSWEAQYQALMKGAMTEELRKKFESEGWTTQSPSAVATPKRV